MEFFRLKPFLKHFLLLSQLACLWYLYDSIHSRGLYFFFVVALWVVLVALGLLVKRAPESKRINLHFSISATGVWIIFSVLLIVLVVTFYTVRFPIFDYGSGRMLAGIGLAGLGALLLCFTNNSRSPYLNFALMFLLLGVVYRVAAFLPDIQAGPFSLGWSEGSRFYNASLFLSQKLYGEKLPLPVLHPSRYLMQVIPFLTGSKSILFHRIWQVLLWLGLTAWGSYLMAKRVKPGLKFPLWVLTLWFFLFFFQGSVYYHLMVCVILVLLGYRKGKPGRTLIFVLLASVWAGISRVNWMPVPSLLATALYLMDEPFDGKHWGRYLASPIVWVLSGFAAAFASKQAYVAISGENPALFDSAFSSSLLWNRLLPNSTFFLGILVGIGLVSLPLGILVWKKAKKSAEFQLHWLRRLGLGAILLAFLIGGILVSLKIGGGGDLHNLDAFLVFWALINTSFLANLIVPDSAPGFQKVQAGENNLQPFWVMMAVVIPVFFAFMRSGSWSFIPKSAQEQDLQQLQQALDLFQDQPGEVLFISERQLVTFGEIQNVSMVPEYEKVFLMEMAMGDNQGYLEEFYQQVNDHSFSAIVIDPISTNIQGLNHSFAQENNAWVEKVLLPLLEKYELVLSWQDGAVNLLIPKGEEGLRQELLQLQP